MKLVALEEHFATPEIMAAWQALPPDRQDPAVTRSTPPEIERGLFDLADERIRQMDAQGIDVQVLSLTSPAVQSLEPAEATRMAQAINDLNAATVRGRPDRFQGFATLPTPAPAAAARELERAVRELGLHGAMLHGGNADKNLDHPDFLPIFEAAAAHRAPIYIHPRSPRPAVRDAYYTGFGGELDGLFTTAGIGWHYEAGIQVARLVLSSVFDRLPELQLIMGHWGEAVLFYLDRIDLMAPLAKKATGLKRAPSEYFTSNVSVTPSGLWSQRYFRWACEVLGPERIMFSTDYPFAPAPKEGARGFLQAAELGDAERKKVASGNWERLCAGIRR